MTPSRRPLLSSSFSSFHLRFYVLMIFLVVFVAFSITMLEMVIPQIQRVSGSDFRPESRNLHSLLAGSLRNAGMHSDDILGEKVFERRNTDRLWNEYRTEIRVSDSFPLNQWLQALQASLSHTGSIAIARKRPDGLTVEVCVLPKAEKGELLIETLIVRVRPSPDFLASQLVKDEPQIALVFDDLGQNPAHFRKLVALEIPFTASILPHLPYSLWTAREAAREGVEVLLHLPMEPVGFPENRPGPGALFVEMTPEKIRNQLSENLETVPGARGVNNHMGSRITADLQAMDVLMKELKDRDLFFLDSKTSAESLAFDTAFRHNLFTAERDIFLDALDDPAFIRGQIEKLIRLARKRGVAIGIGHPYPNTLSVLEEMGDYLLASGINWIPVSQLMIQSYREQDQILSSLSSSGDID